MSQTNLDGLVINQPHPTMHSLYFAGVTKTGSEKWRTADELADDANYHSRYRRKYQSEESLKVAAKRKATSKAYDREAENVLTRYSDLGMERSVFAKLDRPVKERVKRACPNIIITSAHDREQRRGARMAGLTSFTKQVHAEAVASMAAKMERAKHIHKTLDIVENVTLEDIEAETSERKTLTQADLNELSNSRYEMPKCCSDYEGLKEDAEEGLVF